MSYYSLQGIFTHIVILNRYGILFYIKTFTVIKKSPIIKYFDIS